MLLPKRDNAKYIRRATHPSSVITPKGNVIDLSGAEWLIPVSTFTSQIIFEKGCLAPLASELRDYGYERLSTLSEAVVNNTFNVWLFNFNKFLSSKGFSKLDWADFNISVFEEYLHLLRDNGAGYRFWHIQTVINWLQLNHPGLMNEKVAKEVLSWKIEGNKKGEAVALNNPYEGALTKEETDQIRYVALDTNNNATLLERVTVLLFLETGQRNGQISLLEIDDLKALELVSKGVFRYFVRMPSNKVATGKRDISITKTLFDFCLQLNRNNKKYYQLFDSTPLLIIDPKIDWILPAWFDADKQRWNNIRRPNSWDLNSIIKGFCERFDILDRFGEPINIFARRFRRTIATRMAEQGASPEAVAKFLDHADVQQVMVYFEFHKHRKQQRLEEAAGPLMRSLSESMKGRLIADATKARNPAEILPFFDSEKQDVFGFANCGRDLGKNPVCDESQINACYGCNYFQPYDSDIHEKVLSNLEERKQTLVQIQGLNRGRLIDGIDKSISDVQRVVDAVKEARKTDK